jgi:hypothetical protein
VALPSWHHKAGYLTPSGAGSLETWNRGDHGCTVTALGSCMASNARPSVWHANRLHQRLYSGRKWYEVDEVVHTYCLDGQPHPFFCFGYGIPLPCAPPGCPRVWIPSPPTALPAASANVWMRLGACHIPYQNVIRRIWEWDHIMGGRYEPVKMWLSPGYWQGSATVLEAEWPVGPNGPCVNIPWGGTPGVCNDRHGCVRRLLTTPVRSFSGPATNRPSSPRPWMRG